MERSKQLKGITAWILMVIGIGFVGVFLLNFWALRYQWPFFTLAGLDVAICWRICSQLGIFDQHLDLPKQG